MSRMLAGKKKKIGFGAAVLVIFLAAAIFLTAHSQKVTSGPVVESTGVAIRGTVTDESKAPLPNAKVFVYSAGVREGTSPYCPTCYADCAKSGTTDEQGNFVIENVDPALVFRLLVAASGFKPQFKGKVDPAKGTVEIVVKKRAGKDLDKKPALNGRILSPEGKPVAGAVISPFQFIKKEGSYYGPAEEDAIAVSDQEGRFSLVAGGDCTAVGIDVEARGLAKRKFLALALGAEIHDLKMTVGTAVKGRLVREGKPVGGVNVGICQAERGSDSFLGESIIGTNEKGEFLFTNIFGNDTYYLYGKRDSLKEKGVTPTKLFVAKEDGTTADLGDIEVVPGLPIEAVINLGDGRGLPPKTTVLVDRANAWDALRLQPDEAGKIHFLALEGEVLEIAASIPGYDQVFEKKNPYQDSPSFSIGAGPQSLPLNFKPKSQKEKISGTVVDFGNHPVAGARVVLMRARLPITVLDGKLQRGYDNEAVDSGAEGQFSVSKEDDSLGLLALHAKGYAYVPLQSWQGTVVLKPWAEIHGKAFLGKTPASGKKVTLLTQPTMQLGEQSPGFICNSAIDESGNYRIEHVVEGLQLLGIATGQNGPFGSSWFQQAGVAVRAGDLLELSLGGKGAAVSGKMELPENLPESRETGVTFGSLTLQHESHAGKVLEGDEAQREMVLKERKYGFIVEKDGSFKIEDVLPGSYYLMIRLRKVRGPSDFYGEAFAQAGMSVTVGEEEAITLEPLRLVLEAKPLKVGDVLPGFEIENVKGEKISNATLKNNVTLFRFHSAMDDDAADQYFVRLLAGLGPQKQMVVLSFGMSGNPGDLIKKYKDSQLPWQECSWSYEKSPLTDAFPIQESPYYVVIGPEGKVRASNTDFEVVKKALAEAFGENLGLKGQ